ncbi:M23 family metallopeptidase [Candidatus Berkiella cookevillensis]|uniref:M23 family metallopeptidase n=1 Tax=Candidatus Berkiella cookevillensis TaxID=437022 RepID=A0A0Q9YCL7_9GAMM|nr:M23 family metallopeptidase [Candidatus Berkiella cookevillensis]MCS5708105.1 M23 family metallopeptidase [Candidatus Berkiella cookevillensis]
MKFLKSCAQSVFLFSLCLFFNINVSNASSINKEGKDFFSVIVAEVFAAPQAVKVTTDQNYFTYEIQLTNTYKNNIVLKKLSVVNTDDVAIVYRDYSDIKGQNQRVGDHEAVDTLAPGQSSIFWVSFFLADSLQIPTSISHLIEYEADAKVEQIRIAQTPINPAKPVVISAPLEGKNWLAINGWHRRAMMPINGKLFLAQRYALDYIQLDDNHKLFQSMPLENAKYFGYNQPILAVADGLVIEAVDEFSDQVPGKFPTDITLQTVNGNYVLLDIGGGNYAYYAHIKPGSVEVKKGQTLKKGQVIGKVGNTGNSSAPHLHFHIIDSTSPLGSNGVPFVFENLTVIGHAKDVESVEQSEATGVVADMTIHEAKQLKNVYPLNLDLIHY